ncbi:hypothetical protein F4827_004465 [Paraburkholderia bannensis]|uniref:Tetratricopeptide repeat protein n=1 Tax=Paraburkholderia bannensis TaxID=765414 RepID=A0A7W9WUQ9_9BURK|nr:MULTISPECIES: hypothetical protein [Paraburkholderia]MBB3259590.1 hypothetical protein [Paraburkholderia sp. WP4_3_2]MBB6104606.1 hypothetical protein [Paraburkholderia bannensis]
MSPNPEHRLLDAFVAHTRQPADSQPLQQICEALIGVRRDEQMLPWAEKGLALEPHSRTFVHARARALRLLGHHAQAAQTWIDYAALDWSPLFYLGRLGRDLYLGGSVELAIAVLKQALQQPEAHTHPDKLRARKWLAEAMLSTGDANGFTHWLWRNCGDSGSFRHSEVPMWNGQRDLRGERVLVTHQMGYGDQFMLFASLRHWRAAGAEIMVTCDLAIHSLIEASLPDCRVVACDRPLEIFAPCGEELLPAIHAFAPTMQATLLHLPMLAIGDAPRPAPYFPAFLQAPAAQRERATAWAHTLRAQHGGKKLVGLFWDCAQRHESTMRSKERSWAGLRSLPLEMLERLTLNPEIANRIQFVSLHHPAAEMKSGSPRGNVAHYGPGIASFADTAACIEQLDAVLSVDSGIANLAAMAGKPTAVLVNPTGEWRWGRHSTRSPWMESAHILRQTTMGDWHGVIELAANWLAQRS